MILILFLALSFIGLVFQKSKFLTFLIFIFTWITSWTMFLPDYDVYRDGYGHDGYFEIGYQWFSDIFYLFGIDYFTFRIISFALGLGIYCWFIIRATPKCSLVASLYLLTVWVLDVVQCRNFLGFALVLIGVYFLIKQNTLKSKLIFALFVLIGSTFHIGMLFYLSFLISQSFLKKQSITTFIILGFFALTAFYYLGDRFENKFNDYDIGVSMLSKVLLLVLYVGNALFIKKNSSTNRRRNNVSHFTNLFTYGSEKNVVYFNYLILLSLPAAFMSLTSLRLYRNLAVVNYSYVANRKIESHYVTDRISYTVVLLLYSLSYLLIAYIMHSTSFPLIIEGILNHNLIFVK